MLNQGRNKPVQTPKQRMLLVLDAIADEDWTPAQAIQYAQALGTAALVDQLTTLNNYLDILATIRAKETKK